jgi:hypothetical protein
MKMRSTTPSTYAHLPHLLRDWGSPRPHLRRDWTRGLGPQLVPCALHAAGRARARVAPAGAELKREVCHKITKGARRALVVGGRSCPALRLRYSARVASWSYMLPSSNLRRCGWGWAACKRKHSFAEFTAQEARCPPPARPLAAVNSWAGDAERTFPMPWQRCARVHSFAMRAPITVWAVLTSVRRIARRVRLGRSA